MSLLQLPETVEKALGRTAARDLARWLEDVIKRTSTIAIIPISEFVARQKVNAMMLDRVSDMLLAGDPELVRLDNEKLVWRVPVYLTAPSRGRVGQVGTLDVDAQMGEIAFSERDLTEIAEKAEQLAQGFAS